MPKHKYDAYAGEREVEGKTTRFASRMEFNYYLYLAWLKRHGEIKDFEYQPEPFDFRARAEERPDLWTEKWLPQKKEYRPDFKIINRDGSVIYVETLGKLRRSHNKNFKLLARLFPDVQLKIVDGPQYRVLDRQVGAIIPGWERGKFKDQEHRFGKRRIPYLSEITR